MPSDCWLTIWSSKTLSYNVLGPFCAEGIFVKYLLNRTTNSVNTKNRIKDSPTNRSGTDNVLFAAVNKPSKAFGTSLV